MSEQSRSEALDFQYKLFLKGTPVGPKTYNELLKAGYIKDQTEEGLETNTFVISKAKNSFYQLIGDDSQDRSADLRKDEYKDYSKDTFSPKPIKRANIETIVERFDFKPFEKEIIKADWTPDSVIYHKEDFVKFIDSILYDGFQNRKQLDALNKYRQQAYYWLAEDKRIEDCATNQEVQAYKAEERRRNGENSLYALNKYLMLQEGSLYGGKAEYIAEPFMEIVLYLLDAGYSCAMIKGRQVGATSTLGGWMTNKLFHAQNFFGKYICIDQEKTEEIFNDKIKYAFSEYPEWYRMYRHEDGELKSVALNDRDNMLRVAERDYKGSFGGLNSRVLVTPPSVYAINGGSPTFVGVDEPVGIRVLSKMVKEQRPTMFIKDPETGKLRMARQLWMWSTGGVEDTGGKAWEREYMAILEQWQKRSWLQDTPSGMVPLFFDWTCRPGMSPQFYQQEKAYYYSVTGVESETSQVQFHQHYPTTISDVFLSSDNTLMSIRYITDRINECRGVEHNLRPRHGYLEPIYDESKPLPEGAPVPFKVVGARFVEADDYDQEDKKIVTIFIDAEPDWVDRFYGGTDPTASVGGSLSNMSSSVWDDHLKTIAGVVSSPFIDNRKRWLQSALLMLYYGRHGKGIPELVERNSASGYFEFKKNLSLDRNLVLNAELPDEFRIQSDATGYGIDNYRGEKNKLVINKMYELFKIYGGRIWIETYWTQLSTFFKKITKTGLETWEPKDRRHYKDDNLFSATFAYICKKCFDGKKPRKVDENKEKQARMGGASSFLGYDKDFNLIVNT